MKISQVDTKKTILRALTNYAKLITPTYGPAGKKVLIATSQFSIKAADDGHTVSNEIEFENEFDNGVVQYIKETTEKTNSRVGDGTTTSVILTEAIVKEAMGDLDNDFEDHNYYQKVKEIQKGTKEAIEHIKIKAQKVKTDQELYKVAYNSYNNEEIAKLISNTLSKIGKDGVLTIEDSKTSKTELEMVEGFEFEKGFASPYFINSDREKAVLNDPLFLLFDGVLNRFKDIVGLLKGLINSGNKNIVIIAGGFSEEVLGHAIMDKINGFYTPILIECPGFGDNKLDNLKDIASVINAKIFDEKVSKIESASLEDLGTVKKIVTKKDKTVLIGGNAKTIKERVKFLTEQLETASDGFQKEKLQKTIATLTGGIALIKVGANTENEQKSIKMKVEDAINATKIALQDGVVSGAGKIFMDIETSSPILNKALKAPRAKLEENGKEFLDKNVIDPAGVLIAALETASSIACGLLMIEGIIVTKREDEKD